MIFLGAISFKQLFFLVFRIDQNCLNFMDVMTFLVFRFGSFCRFGVYYFSFGVLHKTCIDASVILR